MSGRLLVRQLSQDAIGGRKVKRNSNLALGLAALLIAGSVAAQTTYPEKPIRMVVAYQPGSQVDTVARLLGQKLAEALAKPIVIDNAAGASGGIGTDRVAKATPDGYTLGMLAPGPLVVNPSLYKLAYDPVRDFAPVSQVVATPNMLVVHNGVPAKSLEELVALAKAQPGVLSYASGGAGITNHMAAELLKSAAGLDIRHVPYKGVGTAIPDVLAGRVTMMFGPVALLLPLSREGKLRALAVASLKRSSVVPEVPTIAESGYPGFEVTVWTGMLAPAKTPAAIVGKLHVEAVRALAIPELRTKFIDLGLEIIGNSPDEFAAIIKSEIPKWAKVIKDAGIKVN